MTTKQLLLSSERDIYKTFMPFFDKIARVDRRWNNVTLKQLLKKQTNNGLLKLVINDSLLFSFFTLISSSIKAIINIAY